MILVGILEWWYGAGFVGRLRRLGEMLDRMTDYFSISLLLRTMFAPFRQISAGQVQGPLPVQLRAWADRQFSRFVGATVRIIMILLGSLALSATVVYAFVLAIVWLVMPLLPIAGLIMMMTGWVPWHL